MCCQLVIIETSNIDNELIINYPLLTNFYNFFFTFNNTNILTLTKHKINNKHFFFISSLVNISNHINNS